MLEPKEGWEEDTLSNCCIKAKNIKWGKDTPSHKYIDLSSVDRETSQIYNTIVVTPQDAPSRAKQIVTKGDIIFATTRPTLRRVALICENYDGEICSTGFCVLRPKNHLASKWIFYLLKADRFYNYIEPLQSGANYPAVTDSAVKGYVIPVPPLSEQHSIVATLDSLKSKVDRLQENYDKISQECDALKQAILRKVFE
jgi:type I restriction enzyme S subunit